MLPGQPFCSTMAVGGVKFRTKLEEAVQPYCLLDYLWAFPASLESRPG